VDFHCSGDPSSPCQEDLRHLFYRHDAACQTDLAPGSSLHFKISSILCHPERGDSRARDLTPADTADAADGNARASCSAGAPRISATNVQVS
jgi:hypothetical protein